MQVLIASRKELSDYGRATEELKSALRRMLTEGRAPDITANIEEFLETVPLVLCQWYIYLQGRH